MAHFTSLASILIRIFDILLASTALLIVLPFMAPIMIMLKLTGEHYVFYLQPRVGKGGKQFNVVKFATMLKDSPTMTGGFITQKDDPRVLPFGHFLRATKINELPQLLNIIMGQMSLVGPRPVVERHLNLYSMEAKELVLAQRPGLTGIASLIFRDEEAILNRMEGDRRSNHDAILAPYKGELEIWYYRHKGIRLYFYLILLTAITVVCPGFCPRLKGFKDLPEPPATLKTFI